MTDERANYTVKSMKRDIEEKLRPDAVVPKGYPPDSIPGAIPDSDTNVYSASPPPSDAVPVAWRYKSPTLEGKSVWLYTERDPALLGDHDTQPLYAHPEDAPERPRVVCLCGSTRFYDAFQRANYEETMLGRIVLSVGFYPHSQTQAHGEEVGCTEEQKRTLDDLHLRKIDLADEILVLNVGGYVGESTAREIVYAETHGKPVRFLEPVNRLQGRGRDRWLT